jgi:glycosyltransferase A (GT-A) superfamily protein (DUF2064 family)
VNGPHVLVVAKSPVAGRVKTRLCPPCDPEEAAELAEAALADTLDAVAACGVSRRLLALDGAPGQWLPSGFHVFSQCEGSFADRLGHAWATAGGPGLQIGMDTPQVTGDLLDRCLAELLGGGERTAALGLAEDGGWWALGVLRVRVPMFDGVPMSTASTGAAQWRRLETLGHTVVGLPTLVDVDRIEDACAVAREAPATRFGRLVGAIGLDARRAGAPDGTPGR